METSPYMETISAARALLLEQDESTEGGTTISVETCADLVEDDIFSFVRENFPSFLHTLRGLPDSDRDLLLSYYLLGKSQTTLGLAFGLSQTMSSYKLRMAMKTVGATMMFGEPTEELLRSVLTACGCENLLSENEQVPRTVRHPTATVVPLSKIVMEYSRCRDFQTVATRLHLWRPDIRRTIDRASDLLLKSGEPREVAIGAWIASLIANTAQVRTRARLEHVVTHRTDPDIVGEFRMSMTDPDFGAIFTSRARTGD